MGKKAVVLCVLSMVLVAIAGPGSAWAQKGPIKIGVIAPMSGGAAQIGKDMTNGIAMWLDDNNQTIAGRKVEVIVEDSQGQPNIALTRLQRLVESDRVHILVGEVFAHIGYAMAPKVEEYRIPMLYPVIAADDLAQRKPAKWVVRTGWASSQPSHPFGEYAAKTLGYKKIAVIGMDYAFGWEVVGDFQKTFEENGGQIVQKLWAPLNTTDFAPYLSQLKRDADAVFALRVSLSASRFPKQFEAAGLKGKLPLMGGGTTFDEFVLPSLGDEAIGGMSPLIYSAALDTPVNKRFVTDYRKKYGKVPSYFSETCYTSTRWINEAAKAIGGDVENREKFLEALRRVEIPDAPRGPVKLDSHGNPIQNIYVRKVEKKDGELWNTVVHTYPAVSQFSPHRPAALGLARTYQIPNLFPRLTALENCLLAVQALTGAKFHLHRALHRYPAFFARAHGVLEAVGLNDRAGEAVRNLSHGEQRQLQNALALARAPLLLLLDQTTAGLSPAETHSMTGLLN